MRLETLVRTSEAVGATRSRKEKIRHLADALSHLAPAEAAIGASYLSGELPQGRIGIGYATVRNVDAPPAPDATLTIAEVDVTFQRIADTSGPGSQTEKERLFAGLLARGTSDEQRFLQRLVLQELRQGALEGLLVEALAAATGTPVGEVRRAVMVAGDLAEVAEAALADGLDGLRRFRLTLFRPVQPMLAQTAEDLDAAFARVGDAAVEFKLDGARVQVHRDGDDVAVYTRSLRDVTGDMPAVVAAARALPARAIILDGEALALDDDGRPLAFQDTMRHFGAGDGPVSDAPAGTLRPFFFDCLHLDGDDLVDRPGRDRIDALSAAVPTGTAVPRTIADSADTARGVLADALSHGHEGVMVKDLDAPYEAGRRGASWMKVKQTYTLDLVVLAAEWGSGRRKGWLSNLHLGARDPEAGGFVMLGKTFKGLTDETLEWQTGALLARETHREAHVVHVRPELVVEIAFDGVQSSPRYPGGVALRFARVRGYRPDRSPETADTIDTVRAIHGGERSGG